MRSHWPAGPLNPLAPQDTHINNLQNTCLWNLVRPPPTAKPELASGMTTQQAQQYILENAPDSARKNELLFSGFGINYNSEEAVFRKGTTLFYREEHRGESRAPTGPADGARTEIERAAKSPGEGSTERDDADNVKDARKPAAERGRAPKTKTRRVMVEEAIDIIGDTFWTAHPYLLAR